MHRLLYVKVWLMCCIGCTSLYGSQGQQPAQASTAAAPQAAPATTSQPDQKLKIDQNGNEPTSNPPVSSVPAAPQKTSIPSTASKPTTSPAPESINAAAQVPAQVSLPVQAAVAPNQAPQISGSTAPITHVQAPTTKPNAVQQAVPAQVVGTTPVAPSTQVSVTTAPPVAQPTPLAPVTSPTGPTTQVQPAAIAPSPAQQVLAVQVPAAAPVTPPTQAAVTTAQPPVAQPTPVASVAPTPAPHVSLAVTPAMPLTPPTPKPPVEKEIVPIYPIEPIRPSEETGANEKAAIEEGFDTASLVEPSGNWWYKRIWWERAEERYTKIQQEIKQILEMRAPFFSKRTEAEQKIFEPLFINTGLSQGELTIILADLIEEMHTLKAKQYDTLTEEQREFLATLQTHQKMLEELHEDIQKISLIDNELDEALNLLLEIIDKCNGYEREAWEHFRAIAKELSDSRARELYYHIVTLEKTIGDNVTFISGTLAPHFDQLLKLAHEQADRITTAIQSLKEKGIDFKKRAEHMVQTAEAENLQAEQTEEVPEQESWSEMFDRLADSFTNGITSVWDSITGFFSSLYHAVSGYFSGGQAAASHEQTAGLKTMQAQPAATLIEPKNDLAALVTEHPAPIHEAAEPAPAEVKEEPHP